MALPKQLIGFVAACSAASWPVSLQARSAPLKSSYSQQDIRQYASALVQILAVRRVADNRWKAISPAERPMLKRQAQAAIGAILAKHGFNEASFNQMSSEVERRPALGRDVRQRVMRESLGF